MRITSQGVEANCARPIITAFFVFIIGTLAFSPSALARLLTTFSSAAGEYSFDGARLRDAATPQADAASFLRALNVHAAFVTGIHIRCSATTDI